MNAAARLRGLLAVMAIAVILVGLPWVLTALGPPTLPKVRDLSDVWALLLSPDDGTLALAVLKVLGWIAWAVLAASIAVEILAQARRITPPSLHGFSVPQHAARSLVSTAALLFVLSGHAAPLPTAHALPPVAAAADPSPPAGHQTLTKVVAAPTIAYTVKPGDSLWRIAEAHLGSGTRFDELVDLNSDLLGGHADFLRPGWVLQLPADANTVIVQPGDTLSSIARDHFDGDESKYRQIFHASEGLRQPGGTHLSDPDLILPGWHLHLTDDQTSKASQQTPAASQTQPSASSSDPEPAGEAPTKQDAPAADTARPAADASGTAQTANPAATGPAESAAKASGTVQTSAPAGPGAAASPAPASPASPVPSSSSAVAAPDTPAWLLVGLAGGGALLAGALLRVLRQRRASQHRFRRPGRVIATPRPALIPVEKTLLAVGPGAVPTLETLDRALRCLSQAQVASDRPVPRVVTITLSNRGIVLHLVEAADLVAPWHGDDTRLQWHCDLADASAAHVPAPDQATPYPQLVSLGTDDQQACWLLNAEEFGILSLTGDPTYAHDFARYLVADMAVNPWCRDVHVKCINIAEELVELEPSRVQHHTDPARLADIIKAAEQADAWLTELDLPNINAARSIDAGDELWESTIVVTDASAHPATTALAGVIAEHPGRTTTTIVFVGPHADTDELPGVEINLTGQGRARLPDLGLDLVAVGLTHDEARGCAALIAACDDLDDVETPPMPDADDRPWTANCDQAGHLNPTLSRPRDPDEPNETSLLPAADAVYLAVAATTPEDLEALAPQVAPPVRRQVAEADPTLDADLQDWFATTCDRPRLSLLGPITVRVGRGGQPTASIKRKAFYIELLAFLSQHPDGATTEQIADALNLPYERVRKDVSVVRNWLGHDPRTGHMHIPDAPHSRAALSRGVNLYQVDGLLLDSDLFRRLRLRGETRGPAGIPDLETALRLVTGPPFDQLRANGGAWLTDHSYLHHTLTAAIVDVAHLVVVAALERHDYPTARAATEIASLAAPHDEVPNLDKAAIAAAEGHHQEADRILRDDIANRSDDDDPTPQDIPARTQRIINAHKWLTRRAAS